MEHELAHHALALFELLALHGKAIGSYFIFRPEIHSDESMQADTILPSVSPQYPFPYFPRLALLFSSIEVRLIPGNAEQEIFHVSQPPHLSVVISPLVCCKVNQHGTYLGYLERNHSHYFITTTKNHERKLCTWDPRRSTVTRFPHQQSPSPRISLGNGYGLQH
jgi:hypothetical protein